MKPLLPYDLRRAAWGDMQAAKAGAVEQAKLQALGDALGFIAEAGGELRRE